MINNFNITRRELLSLGVAGLAAGKINVAKASETTPALRQLAAERGLLFGTAVSMKDIQADQKYKDLVAQQAGIIVAVSETKRSTIQPDRDRYDFSATDYILEFARSNKQSMRGHTLVWHDSNPPWLLSALESNPTDRLITDYIAHVVGRYKGRLQSWDVVNEPISIPEHFSDGLSRQSPWYKAFGEDYIDIAFHAAHQADPSTPLFLNELNSEIDAPWSSLVRKGSLQLIDRLLKRNVPISGFGMQCHIKGFTSKYSDVVLSEFIDELAARGLKVMITELDVADIQGPADQATRDAHVASLTKRILEVAFSKANVQGALTWGISNKYSWLNGMPKYRWPNGQLSRSLPFDEQFKPTAMFSAIAEAYAKN